MHYENQHVSDLQIAYVGGGSRAWAWTFMTDLAMDASLSGTIRLYDIDVRAAERNALVGNRMSAREYLGCLLMLIAVVLAQLPAFHRKNKLQSP